MVLFVCFLRHKHHSKNSRFKSNALYCLPRCPSITWRIITASKVAAFLPCKWQNVESLLKKHSPVSLTYHKAVQHAELNLKYDKHWVGGLKGKRRADTLTNECSSTQFLYILEKIPPCILLHAMRFYEGK